MRSRFGRANDGIPAVAQWEIEESADLKAIAHSGTDGAMQRILGNQDWRGSLTAQGHTPTKMPWDEFTFTGTIDGTNGATGDVITTGITVNVPVEAGDSINHSIQFEGNGALTIGAVAATDALVTALRRSVSRKVSLGTLAASPSWPDYDIRPATLNLTAAASPYNDTGTNGQTKRKKGNLDGTLAIQMYCDSFAELPTKGTPYAVRLYVTDAQYWQLLWMRVAGVSGLMVDVKSKALIGATVNLALSVVEDIASTPTKGSITVPGGASARWPPSP